MGLGMYPMVMCLPSTCEAGGSVPITPPTVLTHINMCCVPVVVVHANINIVIFYYCTYYSKYMNLNHKERKGIVLIVI